MVWFGLSFGATCPICELRDLSRHRRTLVEERTRVVQRLEKVLQDAGAGEADQRRVESAHQVGVGVMLDALLAGKSPTRRRWPSWPEAASAAKIPALREALAGRFRADHHGFLVAGILADVDFLHAANLPTWYAPVDRGRGPLPAADRPHLHPIPGLPRQRNRDRRHGRMWADMAECSRPLRTSPTWGWICRATTPPGAKRRTLGHTYMHLLRCPHRAHRSRLCGRPHQRHLPGAARPTPGIRG